MGRLYERMVMPPLKPDRVTDGHVELIRLQTAWRELQPSTHKWPFFR